MDKYGSILTSFLFGKKKHFKVKKSILSSCLCFQALWEKCCKSKKQNFKQQWSVFAYSYTKFSWKCKLDESCWEKIIKYVVSNIWFPLYKALVIFLSSRKGLLLMHCVYTGYISLTKTYCTRELPLYSLICTSEHVTKIFNLQTQESKSKAPIWIQYLMSA